MYPYICMCVVSAFIYMHTHIYMVPCVAAIKNAIILC